MSLVLTLAIYVALYALQEYLKPKPKLEDARPATLGDFQFPTATEQRKVPLVWGTVSLDAPNVVWYGDLQTEPIVEKVKTGLWSSKRVVSGYRYYVGLQFGLCRGQLTQLRRIWIGDDEVWVGPVTSGEFVVDAPDLFGGEDEGGGIYGDCAFYPGSSSQTADPYIATFQSVGGDAPGYVGGAYVAFRRFLDPPTNSVYGPGYVGKSTQQRAWRFEVRRIANPLGLSSSGAVNSGFDCNPATMIYELLTDTVEGFGIPSADIDTAQFKAVGEILASEGNGISLKVEAGTDVQDVLREIERQIDGVVDFDPDTGLFVIRLARFDYTVGDLLTAEDGVNVIEQQNPAEGAWTDTSNFVQVPYTSRILDYKKTFAHAQDMANQRIQGRTVSVEESFPGCYDDDLAVGLAWRQLRTLAVPLWKVTLICDRTMSSLRPTQPFKWTSREPQITNMVMRVLSIDLGELASGKVRIDAVQDVFYQTPGSFGTTPGTGWGPPSDDLDPFAKTAIFEAPRAFLTRDPVAPGSYVAKIWFSGEKQGAEYGCEAWYDTTATPSYTLGGTSLGLMRVGVLASALNRGSSPTSTVSITMGSGTEKLAVLDAATAGLTAADLGQNLVHLLRIGNELLLVLELSSGSGLSITATTVYRGVLDTPQEDHASGADVQFLFVGGSLTDATFDDGTAVDVKLLPKSRTSTVAIGDVTAVSLTIADRALRPYPPARITVDGTPWPTAVDLEETGTGDGVGFNVVLTRRDFRTTDEVAALTIDAASIFADFPTANTTEHQVETRVDPGGANTLAETITWASGTTFFATRIAILRASGGALPSTVGVVVTARHVVDGATLESTFDLTWAMSVTSTLSGFFEFGALDQVQTSATYTATQSGTYSATVSTAPPGADIQYQLNGGGWTTLISSGSTGPGVILGVGIGDTIEIRHNVSTGGWQTVLIMDAPSSGQDAFAVLFKD